MLGGALGWRPMRKATCLAFVLSGWRRQRARRSHPRQALCGAVNGAAAQQPLGVGVVKDLEEHSRRVGRSTALVIAVALVEVGEVDLVIEE